MDSNSTNFSNFLLDSKNNVLHVTKLKPHPWLDYHTRCDLDIPSQYQKSITAPYTIQHKLCPICFHASSPLPPAPVTDNDNVSRCRDSLSGPQQENKGKPDRAVMVSLLFEAAFKIGEIRSDDFARYFEPFYPALKAEAQLIISLCKSIYRIREVERDIRRREREEDHTTASTSP